MQQTHGFVLTVETFIFFFTYTFTGNNVRFSILLNYMYGRRVRIEPLKE